MLFSFWGTVMSPRRVYRLWSEIKHQQSGNQQGGCIWWAACVFLDLFAGQTAIPELPSLAFITQHACFSVTWFILLPHRPLLPLIYSSCEFFIILILLSFSGTPVSSTFSESVNSPNEFFIGLILRLDLPLVSTCHRHVDGTSVSSSAD